jgi:hypothetical protein
MSFPRISLPSNIPVPKNKKAHPSRSGLGGFQNSNYFLMIALSTIGTHPPELRAATTTVATTATTSPDWMVLPAHANTTLYTFRGSLSMGDERG